MSTLIRKKGMAFYDEPVGGSRGPAGSFHRNRMHFESAARVGSSLDQCPIPVDMAFSFSF